MWARCVPATARMPSAAVTNAIRSASRSGYSTRNTTMASSKATRRRSNSSRASCIHQFPSGDVGRSLLCPAADATPRSGQHDPGRLRRSAGSFLWSPVAQVLTQLVGCRPDLVHFGLVWVADSGHSLAAADSSSGVHGRCRRGIPSGQCVAAAPRRHCGRLRGYGIFNCGAGAARSQRSMAPMSGNAPFTRGNPGPRWS